MLGGGPHALQHAERGEHGRVPRTAVRGRAAGHEPALPRDDVHVADVGAHVARGVVAAAEGLDEAAVRPQQGLGLVPPRVADDDGLAATQIQAGARRLVRHRAGQVEHIRERRGLVGERVKPGPAQGRPQGRGINRDDRAQPGIRIGAEYNLLVAVSRLAKDVHVSKTTQ